MSKSIKKCLLIVAGSLSLGLGVIGIFIPLLPTTPFLLLSSYCYLKSSNRLYQWLIYHKIFGAYIYHYITYKAVLKSTKIGAFIFLWGTLILSMFLFNNLHLRIFLILIGIGVSVHLYTLKTIRKEDLAKFNTSEHIE
jgi:uncharacterized protein